MVVGNPAEVVYSIPRKGNFTYAHKVKEKAEKYLDYLYISNGGLAFKVNEESHSFADAMSKIPPYYVDVVTRNKMADLNDVQVLADYSTFIHQSENPEKVKECGSFNPLPVDVVLHYGDELREPNTPTGEVQETIKSEDGRTIVLDNLSSATRLELQLEDGEIDEYLKIYANYVRIDDGHGDFHYDLYFNLQNLFNSPFEYISSVTKQPNVLIIPDSYLYLTGDKFKPAYDENGNWTHNEIDADKVEALKQGGVLTLYGQVKTYSGDALVGARTIKLFSYNVYNISDDKPKFLIEKTYDVTKSALNVTANEDVRIEFSDVLWTIDENKFVAADAAGKFETLNEDVIVVQPVHIRHNHRPNDDLRLTSIKFDIVNDTIDFENVPVLCGYERQARTLRDSNGKPYYDHWSDNYMVLGKDNATGVNNLTLKYDSKCGFNFETIFLRWKLPSGFNVMNTLDRLGGYLFMSTASNVVVTCNNKNVTPIVQVQEGHVVARVHEPKKMYLGAEHTTSLRKSGFVLVGLADAIRQAIQSGDKNPTIVHGALSEGEIKEKASETMNN